MPPRQLMKPTKHKRKGPEVTITRASKWARHDSPSLRERSRPRLPPPGYRRLLSAIDYTRPIASEPEPFRFKDLPPEIRNIVYEYALKDCRAIVPSRWRYIGSVKAKPYNILFADKQVYHEASAILAKRATAVLEPLRASNELRQTECYRRTEDNALANFTHVCFKPVENGTTGRISGSEYFIQHPSVWQEPAIWTKLVELRLHALQEFKTQLEAFVAGTHNMEQHRKRYASVNVSSIFWRNGLGDEKREEFMAGWLACLQCMRSDTHTIWTITLKESDIRKWTDVKAWSGMRTVYLQGYPKGVLKFIIA